MSSRHRKPKQRPCPLTGWCSEQTSLGRRDSSTADTAIFSEDPGPIPTTLIMWLTTRSLAPEDPVHSSRLHGHMYTWDIHTYTHISNANKSPK